MDGVLYLSKAWEVDYNAPVSTAVVQRFILAILWCVCGLLTRGAVLIQSADEQFVVRRWQTEDGLPQNSVVAIAQTPDGYLWLATFNGLVRFDGVRFTAYTVSNTPEFRSDFVNILRVGRDGALWIGTNDGGLVRYFEGVFTPIGPESGLSEADIYFILNHPNGGLCVASRKAIYRQEGGNFVEVARLTPEFGAIMAMAFDAEGRIWTQTARGACLVQDGKLVPGGDQAAGQSRVHYDPNDGVLRDEQGRVASVPGMEAWPGDFIAMGNGETWTVGSRKTLTVFKGGLLSEFRTHPFLVDAEILVVYPDREGNVWVGTDGSGLVRLRQKQVKTISRLQGLPSNNTVTIAQDVRGAIWVGRLGMNRGISWVFPSEDRIVADAPGWGEILASSCYSARDGRMWVGTISHGLFYWEGGLFHQQLSGPLAHAEAGSFVRVLFEDSTGGFWVGTDADGVSCFSAGEVRRFNRKNGLSHDRITAIAEDSSRNIWVGTANGVNRISKEGKVEPFYREHGLGVNIVHCLFVDRDGLVWVGTAGGGLSLFNGKGFSTVGVADGLLNDVVAQILEDDFGNLWLGTNRGIGRVRRQDLRGFLEDRLTFIQCVAYGADQGMISEECGGGFQPSCLKDAQGRLWFCTVGGLVMIDPVSAKPEPAIPKVHLEEAWLDGTRRMMPSGGRGNLQLTVPPSTKTLELRFTGIHFSAPDKVTFRYQLEDYDSKWINAGNRRSAFYTGLPPGRYRFRVVVGSNDGVWNEEGASVIVTMQPAWWQKGWFHVALIAGTMGLAGGAYHTRVSRLKRQQEQKAKFSRRLIESQEVERQRIARELHDSLGQSLSVIKNNAYLALSEKDGARSVQEHIQEICDVATESIQEVRQVSHALRPAQLDRLGLTRTIRTVVEQMAKSGDLDHKIEVDDLDGAFAQGEQIHVLRIVQESLNNVLKHARASFIEVSALKDAAFLQISVADDGRGFDPATVYVGRSDSALGLMAIRERVEILGGHLHIDTTPGRGTRLRIRIPLHIQQEQHEPV